MWEIAEQLSPWAALAAIWLLFELPTAVKPGAFEPEAMRPSLDVPFLLTAWALSHRLRAGVYLRRALLGVAGLLVTYRLDQMIFTWLMRDEPLLYDQWFMLRHLLVLIGDLWNPITAAVVGGFIALVSALVYVSRVLLRHAQVLVTTRRRASARVALCVWVVALAAQAGSSDSIARAANIESARRRSQIVRWVAPELAANMVESMATYRGIQRGLERSPYASFEHIELKDKPDVLLFIVESYGRMLSMHEATEPRHTLLLERLDTKLRAAGWYGVSAFSKSSVSGGRSWLAEGTMLMGTPIKYEAVFQHLVARQKSTPNLVSFLARQGYETVLLAPADRNRPGARVANRYGFDRILSNETLGYQGPAMGWGLVPDQYSLAVAQRKVLDRRTRPVFFDFHMVTSHAPWAAVPPLVSDVNMLKNLKGHYEAEEDSQDGNAQVLTRLRRYQRDDDGTFAYMHHLTEPMRRGYQATITYDLQVIARYLAERKEDALVIVIGDHQPPVITKADASFDTPVHVFSRNKARLAELSRFGFVDGMSIPGDTPAALTHAGLFSLFVRTLASSSNARSLPPVLPDGYALLKR